MGSKLSIDKHVSNIEDILEMNPAYFSKLKIENSIPDSITQHLKIWRYYEDDQKPRTFKSAPISLKDIVNANFTFSPTECYLVLFIYKKQADEAASFVNFPHSMWDVIESYTNLTPRGLEIPVASSESISSLNKEFLESFLLPRRANKQEDNKFEHMIFVWNGKTASPLMKAMTLSAALDFDTLISKGKDPFLQVLFSGGYIKDKKLWIGKILQLDSSATKEIRQDLEKKFDPLKRTVSLLKYLFPSAEPRGFKPNGFKERFLKTRSDYREEDEYIMMGDAHASIPAAVQAEEEERSYTEEMSPMESPASFANMAASEYDDFSPLDSARRERDTVSHPAVPRLNISMPKNPNPEESVAQKVVNKIGNLGLGNLANLNNKGNVNNIGSGGSVSKIPKAIPNLKLGRLGDDSASMEVKLDPQAVNGRMNSGRDNSGRDRSDEDRQMSSSARTYDSVESRKKSDSERRKSESERRKSESERRTGAGIKQITNLSLGGLGPRKPLINNYEDLRNQVAGDNMYDAKESDIKRCKREFFSEQCNEVVEGFLFVAGETIAYNAKKLSDYGITHIVNAAGDACENKFPEKINYLTHYIKDWRGENIECVFYDVLAFIENAKQQNGKVLVHCVQGVSRSVALCIAYLIKNHDYTFSKAYEHIRNIREIASPNPAFWAQLYNFQIRLYGPFDSIPSPRVFCIGSYQRETPQTIVARLLFETGNLYNSKSPKTLDPRTVFILQSKDRLYLWIGNEILPENRDRYIAKAESYIKLLQKYEHAVENYTTVHCGEEPREFWALWENEPQVKYGKNKDWDLWFVDLSVHKNVEGPTIYEEQEDEEEEPVQTYTRPGLYSYPELEPLQSVDMEELVDENLLILCAQKEGEKLAYVWRGSNIRPEVDDQEYLANVLRQRWADTDPNSIKIYIETPNDESDDFMDYFQ